MTALYMPLNLPTLHENTNSPFRLPPSHFPRAGPDPGFPGSSAWSQSSPSWEQPPGSGGHPVRRQSSTRRRSSPEAPSRPLSRRPVPLIPWFLSRSAAKQGTTELEVWDQIRRTEEDYMGRGKMEYGLLRDHRVWTEEAGSTAAGLNMICPWSIAIAAPFFTWRSGDDVADCGHMMVPSIGQVIPAVSSASHAISSATEKSGKAHIDPITGQKVKKIIRATYCV